MWLGERHGRYRNGGFDPRIQRCRVIIPDHDFPDHDIPDHDHTGNHTVHLNSLICGSHQIVDHHLVSGELG